MAGTKRKRSADALPAGGVSIWELLRAEIAPALAARPENSVTPAEFAQSHGFSDSHSRKLLMNLAKAGKLKSVVYRVNGARGTCYVPVEKSKPRP
jgi:hypothetical protein